MTQQIWDWIKQNAPTIGWIIAFLSLFIEISPIKINPWTALFKCFGRAINGDLIKKVDSIEKSVTENEKDRIRWEILDFANSCRNGRLHTRDEFQHIITLDTKYKRLLEETHDSNGVFELEMEYIHKIYAERLEKNDFLA